MFQYKSNAQQSNETPIIHVDWPMARCCGGRRRRLVSGQPAPSANSQGWSLLAAIFAPRVPCTRDPGFFVAGTRQFPP